MWDWLVEIDNNIFLFFNSMRNGFFDTFFHMFSERFIWVPMYIAILFTFYRSFNWRQATVFVLCTVLTITLTDQIGASLIRPYFERPRPFHPDSPVSEFVMLVEWHRPGGSYGFPSCHAANTIALATLVSLWLKRRPVTLFLFLWAIVTCYSRIYLAAHYPGDLVAGALLGLFVAWGIYCFSRWVNRKVAGNTFLNHERSLKDWLGIRYASTSIITLGLLTIIYISLVGLWRII